VNRLYEGIKKAFKTRLLIGFFLTDIPVGFTTIVMFRSAIPYNSDKKAIDPYEKKPSSWMAQDVLLRSLNGQATLRQSFQASVGSD
jgi:hypothetical protein